MTDPYAQLETICEMEKRCIGHAIGRVLRDKTRKLARDITTAVSERSVRRALLLQLCNLEDAIRASLHVRNRSSDDMVLYEE